VVEYSSLEPGQMLYIIEEQPISILELKIGKIVSDDKSQKIKITNDDISFEIEFESIAERVFTDKEYARYVMIKQIFDKTNKYIQDLTDGKFNDYFELENAVEEQRYLYPHRFI